LQYQQAPRSDTQIDYNPDKYARALERHTTKDVVKHYTNDIVPSASFFKTEEKPKDYKVY